MVKLTDPGPIEFDSTIQEEEAGSGFMTWVDFPFDLKATYGKGNLVPIKATFDHTVEYQGSLAKMGGDCALLLVRTDVREQLGKRGGDVVHVRIELDATPRTVILADDAQAALDQNAEALAFWASLSPSNQRLYHQWIEDAKKPETRARRIAQMVDKLASGQKFG